VNLSFKKQLSRRALLRGTGAAIALPVLDAMVPALAAPATSKSPSRMIFLYFPNGVQVESWWPKTESPSSTLTETLPPVLQPLAEYRKDILLLGGLTNDGGRAHGDGPGDHGRAGAAYLTGAHPKKTFGKDIQVGQSIDQFVAQKIGAQTRYASLELGCEEGIQGGNCDNGYSCAYSNSISWRTASTPNPPEVRPRAIFERLFGSGDFEKDPIKRAKQERYRRSVLDSVLEDARRLQANLGATDRRKVDEYLYAIREIETRVEKAEKTNAGNAAKLEPALDKPPSSVPEHYGEHSRLMFDLITAALRTDSTRVITFLMAIEQSNRAYREIGIADSHHGLTHHGGDKEKIAKCIQINRYQIEQFKYFIAKLKATQDGDGTLFDHVMVSYGSGLGRDHDHDNLPTVLTGRGNGLFHLGRYVKYPAETPLANLHLSMMEQMGVSGSAFADSTGKLDYLTSL
jgi:hypothetical protein